MLPHLIAILGASSAVQAAPATPKYKDYETETCKITAPVKRTIKVIRRGLVSDDENEGYYKIFLADGKREFQLTKADGFAGGENPKGGGSICDKTRVYPRKDGLIWVLAEKDDRPMPALLVGAIYSPQEKKILAEFTGRAYESPYFKDGELYYKSIIPRTDLGGGELTFKGETHKCHERELPIVHHVSYQGGKVQDEQDLQLTYSQFQYASFFKNEKDLAAYFGLPRSEDDPKLKRWVYVWDSIDRPDCLYASPDSERDCAKATPENTRCLK